MCEISKSVIEKRIVIPRSEIPNEWDGEYYATWVSEAKEQTGLYFAPWVMWDVDAPDVNVALENARTLVQGLLNVGVTDAMLRIVFSTRKGFHVYLDSRVVALAPATNLHERLKKFCMTLMPTSDESFYTKRRIVGIPNSKHRNTHLFYTPLGIDEFFEGSVQNYIECAEFGGVFEPLAESAAEITSLVELWSQWQPKGGVPASKEFDRRLNEGHYARAGVGEGKRDRVMFEYAVHCRVRGLTPDEAFILIYETNTRNKPPLDEMDLRRIIRSTYGK